MRCRWCGIEIAVIEDPRRWNDASRVGGSGAAICRIADPSRRELRGRRHAPDVPEDLSPEAVERWLSS